MQARGAYYPQQLNGYDCGLFMLGALHVVQGLESEITLSHWWQSNMAQFAQFAYTQFA